MRSYDDFDPSDGFGPDDWYDEDDGFEDSPDLDTEDGEWQDAWKIEEPAH